MFFPFHDLPTFCEYGAKLDTIDHRLNIVYASSMKKIIFENYTANIRVLLVSSTWEKTKGPEVSSTIMFRIKKADGFF